MSIFRHAKSTEERKKGGKSNSDSKASVEQISKKLLGLDESQQVIFLEDARKMHEILSSEISHYEEISVLKLGFLGVILAALIGVFYSKSGVYPISYLPFFLMAIIGFALSVWFSVISVLFYNRGEMVEPFPLVNLGEKYFDIKISLMRYVLTYLLNVKISSKLGLILDVSNFTILFGVISLGMWYVDSVVNYVRNFEFWFISYVLLSAFLLIPFLMLLRSLKNNFSFLKVVNSETDILEKIYLELKK